MDFLNSVFSTMNPYEYGDVVRANKIMLGKTKSVVFVGIKDGIPYIFEVVWAGSKDLPKATKLMENFDSVIVVPDGICVAAEVAKDINDKRSGAA